MIAKEDCIDFLEGVIEGLQEMEEDNLSKDVADQIVEAIRVSFDMMSHI